MKPVILPTPEEFYFVKDNFPHPIAYKIKQIQNMDNPEQILDAILETFEYFYLLMTLLMLSQYFFDKLQNPEIKDERINTRLYELQQKEKMLYSEKVYLLLDLLELYRHHKELLVIRELPDLFFTPPADSFFFSEALRELKKWPELKIQLKGIPERDTTLADLTRALLIFRNKKVHGEMKTSPEMNYKVSKERILTLWRIFLRYLSFMKFFRKYTLGYLESKHFLKPECIANFLEFQGAEKPDIRKGFIRDREIFQALEVGHVYFGKLAVVDNYVPIFVPVLTLNPLIIYIDAQGDGGELYLANRLGSEGFKYINPKDKESYEASPLIEESKSFWMGLTKEIQWGEEISVYKRLRFLRENRKATYKEYVIIAYLDGKISPEERKYLEEIRRKFNITEEEARRIEQEALSDRKIRSSIKEAQKEKAEIYKQMFKMALADGMISEEEREALKRSALILGLSLKTVSEIETEVLRDPEIKRKIERYKLREKRLKGRIYEFLYELAFLDGEVSKEERLFLDRKKVEFGLEESEALAIEKRVREKYQIPEVESVEDRKEESRKLVNEGNEALEKGERKRAYSSFIKAKYYDPENPEAYKGLGYWYILRGDYRKAVDSLWKAFLLNSHDTSIYKLLARALYKSGRPHQALVFAKEAVKLEPSVFTYYLLAHIYKDYLNDSDSAIEVLKEALSSLEDKKDREKIAAYLEDIYEGKKDTDTFAKVFEI